MQELPTVNGVKGVCPACGQEMDVPGLCPKCGEPNTGQCGGGKGQWTECGPPLNDDCNCPIIGYTRLHVPGCKYF